MDSTQITAMALQKSIMELTVEDILLAGWEVELEYSSNRNPQLT